MQLTQKETDLLKDLKGQEQLCIEKYTKHASTANDAQLQDLFTQLAQQEQQHLTTIQQMEQGTAPQMGGGQSSSKQKTFTENYGIGENPEKKADCFLCSDVLSAEKHVSQVYNTSIFEFQDTQMRDALNHIQKEEQEHGKQIYDYMKTNNMYS